MVLSIINRAVAYLSAILLGLLTYSLVTKWYAVTPGISTTVLLVAILVEVVLLAKLLLFVFKTTEKILLVAVLVLIASVIVSRYLFPDLQSFYDFLNAKRSFVTGEM
jgi:hypothetical protein